MIYGEQAFRTHLRKISPSQLPVTISKPGLNLISSIVYVFIT